MRRLILPLMLFVFAACQPAAVEQQAATTGPDVEAVSAWLEQYSAFVSAGDVDGWATLCTDDVVAFPPDAPAIVGMEELRSLAETIFRENTERLVAKVDEVVVAGDLAVLQASYEETLTPKGEGEPVQMSGAWLVILRKQSDGSWKMWREMWSVVPPPPPQAM